MLDAFQERQQARVGAHADEFVVGLDHFFLNATAPLFRGKKPFGAGRDLDAIGGGGSSEELDGGFYSFDVVLLGPGQVGEDLGSSGFVSKTVGIPCVVLLDEDGLEGLQEGGGDGLLGPLAFEGEAEGAWPLCLSTVSARPSVLARPSVSTLPLAPADSISRAGSASLPHSLPLSAALSLAWVLRRLGAILLGFALLLAASRALLTQAHGGGEGCEQNGSDP